MRHRTGVKVSKANSVINIRSEELVQESGLCVLQCLTHTISIANCFGGVDKLTALIGIQFVIVINPGLMEAASCPLTSLSLL